MSLSILVDMNLSPEWVDLFTAQGWPCMHWSPVGDRRTPDSEVMAWSIENWHIVFTHDLDVGVALAVTRAGGPSVLQLRSQRVLPEQGAEIVISTIRKYEHELRQGALIVMMNANGTTG